MHTAEISFTVINNNREAAFDVAAELLGIWYKNGQIVTDKWHAVTEEEKFRFVVWLADKDSLELRYDNEYASSQLASLERHGLSRPAITVWGKDPGTLDVCRCGAPSSYVLYTHFFSSESPVRCSTCFDPVPLYRLHADDNGEYSYILHWFENYHACDTLQLLCCVGESFGEQELFEFDISLSRLGREICGTIAEKSGVLTYYYLFKARGETIEKERKRRCPLCAGEWLLDEPWHRLFDFKCDRCHLLSNIACGLEE